MCNVCYESSLARQMRKVEHMSPFKAHTCTCTPSHTPPHTPPPSHTPPSSSPPPHTHPSRDLGMEEEEAHFVPSSIAGYQPAHRPDIVLALHACDTATDEALALAVQQVGAVACATTEVNSPCVRATQPQMRRWRCQCSSFCVVPGFICGGGCRVVWPDTMRQRALWLIGRPLHPHAPMPSPFTAPKIMRTK